VKHIVLGLIGALFALAVPFAASAELVSLDQSQLNAATGTIVFTSAQIGAYADIPYAVSSGPFAGTEIVFGSYFQGQTPQGVDPVTIPGPPTPGQPLQLLYDGNDYIQVVDDAASGGNPVLAGGPLTFRQPISILFTTPVIALGLTVGYLDQAGAVTIDAYDADGNEIGSVTSDTTGFQNFGLLASYGPSISGLTIQGTDPAGFGIDNVFLATPVPEPAGLMPLLAGLGGLMMRRRLRR
jgi:hypothetical protein